MVDAGALQPPLVLYISERERETIHQMSADKAEVKEKALEKMTVKDLREMAKDMPEIVGVHGMKKEELVDAIKKAKGIVDEKVKKTNTSIRQLKQNIKSLKDQRRTAIESKDRKMATIYKRRISRLKKKTRQAAI
jgi:uncharacterized protein (DUF2252 family)